MSAELKMPALSPTMEKGTLARWLVKPGDLVRVGDLIAEVETDKATMEVEAVDDGQVAELIVPEGTENVPVGAVIARLAGAREAAELTAPQPTGAVPEPEPELSTSAATATVTMEAAPPPAPQFPRARFADRIKVSPLAERIAHANGIDLSAIVGSGPGGRIVRADLGLPDAIATTARRASPVHNPIVAFAPPAQGVPVETVKLSGMRKTIARRLTDSKQQVPHFYLTARCNLDPLLKLRAEINAELGRHGVKLSVNDMLMKALAKALVAVPDANVQFGSDVLHRYARVDIAMAVAIEGGLITPVIRGVESLSLSAIALQSKELADKARNGSLAPEDYLGGTCSLSNLGMFGIDEMFPVINPPQALILGTAAGVKQPWNVEGELALATIMAATGSFDHRAIDGAVAAQFMAEFRRFVETPMLIVC
jgi:pyruvate dehydrogenase E2 component (dihydrolipoamide acetyltransferase)